MRYSHTQRAPLHYVIEFWAIVALAAAWFVRDNVVVFGIVATGAAVTLLFALAFRTLTVADAGDALYIRFGPLPLFAKRFVYADIAAAEAAKSRWIDGWGIHWIPWRGWTYNLWGFDCVKLDVGGKTVRIGSDDVAGLVAFLHHKTRTGAA
ncbi:MAG: hypothetical protein KDA63_19395 [Planctomycetales bacterium]|nr:hypothetical protein [Planctomycetales bacterium]